MLWTGAYAQIVPPYLPWHRFLVYVSGAAEIAGALGLLIPSWRRLAAWGLVLLLIAVFPANVYMANHGVQINARPMPQWLLWARLPLQALLIWWILWCTAPSSRVPNGVLGAR